MNCFTLMYVLQKPEDSSEHGALPVLAPLLWRQLVCRGWLCLPAPSPMAPSAPWAGAAVSPGLALGRDTSSPWPHSGDSHHPTHGRYGTAGCLNPAGRLSAHFPKLRGRGMPGPWPRGPLSHQDDDARAPVRHQGPQDHPVPSPGSPAQDMPSPKADALRELSSGEGAGHPLQVQWLEGDKDEVDAGPEVHCTLWVHEVMRCSCANIQLKASNLCSVHPRGQQEGRSRNESACRASPRLPVPPGRDTRSPWPAAKSGHGEHRAGVCPRVGGSREQGQQQPPPTIAGLVLADSTGWPGGGVHQGPRETGRGQAP